MNERGGLSRVGLGLGARAVWTMQHSQCGSDLSLYHRNSTTPELKKKKKKRIVAVLDVGYSRRTIIGRGVHVHVR